MKEIVRLFNVLILIFCMVIFLTGVTLLLRYSPSTLENFERSMAKAPETEKPTLWHAPDTASIRKTRKVNVYVMAGN